MPSLTSNQKDPPLTPDDLKYFMNRHIEAARTLMRNGRRGMVAYHLGYALEFALKACVCKHLSLTTYPSSGKEEDKFFKSHSFQRLYMLAGVKDLFDRSNPHARLYDSFTQEYTQGEDWTKMRYDKKKQKYLSDERVVKRLYNALVGQGGGGPRSIIGIMKANGKL